MSWVSPALSTWPKMMAPSSGETEGCLPISEPFPPFFLTFLSSPFLPSFYPLSESLPSLPLSLLLPPLPLLPLCLPYLSSFPSLSPFLPSFPLSLPSLPLFLPPSLFSSLPLFPLPASFPSSLLSSFLSLSFPPCFPHTSDRRWYRYKTVDLQANPSSLPLFSSFQCWRGDPVPCPDLLFRPY